MHGILKCRLCQAAAPAIALPLPAVSPHAT